MKKLIKDKRNLIIVIISIICLVAILVAVSYALWSYTAKQTTINKVYSDCINIKISDETNAINLEESYPITDEEADKLSPYTFKLENTCNLSVSYDVNLEVMDIESRLNSKYVALDFNGKGKNLLTNYPSATPTYNKSDYTAIESYGLTSGVLNQGESVSYTIKLWLDESTPATSDTMNKDFISKIIVNASLNQVVDAYTESILNGADPVLADNLIPVVIADDGTVTKANIETEWYSYADKVWANAVILEDESITYNNYDVIPEENIESYFVWIPRYKYKIWDEGQYTELTTIDTTKVHQIEVVFETTDVEASTGSTINSWLTHPAFTSFDVNGLWVGKFESGYKGATTTTEAQSNTNEPEKLQIKPNVYSWRGIQVANAHLTSYNYNRNLDSHMMKSTEWGAVAYLQHSAYGSQTSVRINNNSSYITGYAAVNEPTTGYTTTNISCSATPEECNEYGTSTSITKSYNTDIGYLASTTGNISGIYDMSGGSYDYVMGILTDSSGKPMSGRNKSYNSGFVGTYGCPTCDSNDGTTSNTEGIEWPALKYYDLYSTQSSSVAFKNRILGDATGEMGPFGNVTYGSLKRQIGSWYIDEIWFVSYGYPWFARSGNRNQGTGAGIFASVNGNGNSGSGDTFRVVLAPQK